MCAHVCVCIGMFVLVHVHMMFVLLNLHYVFYVCVISRCLNVHVMSVCLYISLNVQKVPVFSMYV